MPNKTLVSSKEKEAKGFKKPKDRVTVMPCANATGSIKFPLLFVHKSLNPRCLKMLTRMIFQSTIMPKRAHRWIPPFSPPSFMISLFRDVEKLLKRKFSPNELFSFYTMLPPILILIIYAQVTEKYLASWSNPMYRLGLP